MGAILFGVWLGVILVTWLGLALAGWEVGGKVSVNSLIMKIQIQSNEYFRAYSQQHPQYNRDDRRVWGIYLQRFALCPVSVPQGIHHPYGKSLENRQ